MKLFIVPVLAAATTMAAGKTGLTIEQLIDIKHPSEPIWSPDGRYVAFVWDRAGVSNLFLSNPDGSAPPAPLTSFREGQISNPFWARDGRSRDRAAPVLRSFRAFRQCRAD